MSESTKVESTKKSAAPPPPPPKKSRGKYGRGYIPDPAGHRMTSFGHHEASRATNTPPTVDLRPFAPAVKDQGSGEHGTSSCTGHGTSTGISTACRFQRHALPWEPSETGIYTLGRCTDRPDPSVKLTDDGAEPNQCLRGISEWGVRPSKAPSPDGRNSDADPSTINNEPTGGELELDAKHLVVGAYRIDSKGTARIDAIRKALAAGMPVCFGVFVDTAFEDYDPAKGPIGAPDMSDPSGGGHWLCCVGYRTTAKGETVGIVRNSWGTSWGMTGDCEVSAEHMAAWMDIYVMAVSFRAPSRKADR